MINGPYAVNNMQLTGKKRRSSFRPTNVIRLTDARASVVSRRPSRNWLWALISLPVRILAAFWDWVMESKPSGYPRYKC